MTFRSIGRIRSSYTPETGAPRQGRLAPGTISTLEIAPEFAAGLADLETFSHIIVLYAFDRSRGWAPTVLPPGEKKLRGVFATRSPRRPNPIALTVVELVGLDGGKLFVRGLEAFDGTPILDLKPYCPQFDRIDGANEGWLERLESPDR